MSSKFYEGENLVVVFEAPDQITADIVQSFLVAEGIPSKLVPRKNPDAVAAKRMFGRKYDWGDIVVPESYEQQCKEAITAYMAGMEDES